MGGFRIDPKQQFSKRLARWTAAFWFVYMILLLIIMYLQPTTALYVVYLGIIASVVMLINIYAYNKNSLTEKMLLTFLDKAKLELMLANVSKDKDDSEEETEVSNG